MDISESPDGHFPNYKSGWILILVLTNLWLVFFFFFLTTWCAEAPLCILFESELEYKAFTVESLTWWMFKHSLPLCHIAVSDAACNSEGLSSSSKKPTSSIVSLLVGRHQTLKKNFRGFIYKTDQMKKKKKHRLKHLQIFLCTQSMQYNITQLPAL